MEVYKLKDSFLDEKLKEYNDNKPYNFEFTFQEYIDSLYGATRWLEPYFKSRDLPFIEDLTNTITNERRLNITNESLLKSLRMVIVKKKTKFSKRNKSIIKENRRLYELDKFLKRMRNETKENNRISSSLGNTFDKLSRFKDINQKISESIKSIDDWGRKKIEILESSVNIESNEKTMEEIERKEKIDKMNDRLMDSLQRQLGYAEDLKGMRLIHKEIDKLINSDHRYNNKLLSPLGNGIGVPNPLLGFDPLNLLNKAVKNAGMRHRDNRQKIICYDDLLNDEDTENKGMIIPPFYEEYMRVTESMGIPKGMHGREDNSKDVNKSGSPVKESLNKAGRDYYKRHNLPVTTGFEKRMSRWEEMKSKMDKCKKGLSDSLDNYTHKYSDEMSSPTPKTMGDVLMTPTGSIELDVEVAKYIEQLKNDNNRLQRVIDNITLDIGDNNNDRFHIDDNYDDWIGVSVGTYIRNSAGKALSRFIYKLKRL